MSSNTARKCSWLIALASALVCSKVLAITPYLDAWKTSYPNSSSADIRCQLCHLQREGNEPWNAYGNDIRRIFNEDLDPNTRTIEQAIRQAESLNSDLDSPATSNIAEINSNQQPAWKEGQTNLAFDRNYMAIGEFLPPITLDPFSQKISTVTEAVTLEQVSDGLVSPTAAAFAPIRNLRRQLFVADQTGIVWRIDLNNGAKSIYLDFRGSLLPLGAFNSCGYDERGLIGLAFHPQFASNGRVYLHTSQLRSSMADFTTLGNEQIADHQSVIIEIQITNPESISGPAEIGSHRDILRIDQPQFNHNGGALIFDSQNYLYIGLGDGGGSDDQGVGHGNMGNGGNPNTVLGAILRIDPLGNTSNNGQYSVPESNPFNGTSDGLEEVFAYGFRNPWKLYFNSQGQLFAADVGQNDIEEINLVEAGKHYGWNTKEGRFFFYDNGPDSGTIGVQAPLVLPNVNLIDPLFEYDHDEGISITGGVAYAGRENRFLFGKHIFSDFSKRLLVGDPSTGDKVALNLSPSIFINGLAEDASGEIYAFGSETISTCDTVTSGKIFKLASTNPQDDSICVPIKSKLGAISLVCF